jgi:hypothetical protein
MFHEPFKSSSTKIQDCISSPPNTPGVFSEAAYEAILPSYWVQLYGRAAPPPSDAKRMAGSHTRAADLWLEAVAEDFAHLGLLDSQRCGQSVRTLVEFVL